MINHYDYVHETTPLVSVIMSTYNEPLQWVTEAMESLLNQTYKNIEIVVVLDNPSRDDIFEYIVHLSECDTRIKYIKNSHNVGLSESLNRALKETGGKYIARMDADDISTQDRIERELFFLRENNLDLVSAQVCTIDERGNVLSDGSKSSIINPKLVKLLLKKGNCMVHPTWLGTRESFFNSNHGYRSIKYAEDYDFLLRGLCNGLKYGILGDALLMYRVRSNSISNSNIYNQMIISRFLSKSIEKILWINEKDINSQIDVCNDKRKNRYIQANQYYQKALRDKSVSIFKCYFNLIKASSISSDERKNIINILRFKIISKL